MNSAKFKRPCRIPTRQEFQCILINPNKLVSRCFVIHWGENQYSHPRLGIIAAKKHIRLAVARNEIKRITRESFRHNQTLLSNNDYIVVARRIVLKLEPKQWREELDKLWLKLSKMH